MSNANNLGCEDWHDYDNDNDSLIFNDFDAKKSFAIFDKDDCFIDDEVRSLFIYYFMFMLSINWLLDRSL